MLEHGTSYPSAKISNRLGLTRDLRQPWNLDPDCVLCYMPIRGTKWWDQSGRGNHGTSSGAVFTDCGRSGPAMYFDGINDYVTIAKTYGLTAFTAFTLECWIYPLTVGGDGNNRWIIIGTYPANGGFALYFDSVNANRIYFLCKTDLGAESAIVFSSLTIKDKWHHVVGTHNGTTMRVYYDGILKDSLSRPGTFANAGGLSLSINLNGYYGRMDQVRIYRRALSATEIMNLYQMGI